MELQDLPTLLQMAWSLPVQLELLAEITQTWLRRRFETAAAAVNAAACAAGHATAEALLLLLEVLLQLPGQV